MTLEELDKLGGELFKQIAGAAKGSDPRFENEDKMITTIAMLAVEFIADHKRMLHQMELINKALCCIIDLQAASYQNGIIVKVANEIEIDAEGLSKEVAESAKETFGETKTETIGESNKPGENHYNK